MNRTRVVALVCSAAIGMVLAGCGGNNTGNATIGGKVSGLDAGKSVSLANNNGTAIIISGNNNFTFSNTVGSNSGYSVAVTAQPAGQTCVVNNGSGLTDYSGDDVNNVSVVCSDNTQIGVNVTGLNAGNTVQFQIALQNDNLNTAPLLPVSVNGTTSYFGISLPLGTIYSISVYAQPGQTVNSSNQVIGTQTQVCTTNSTSYSGGVVNATPIVASFSCH